MIASIIISILYAVVIYFTAKTKGPLMGLIILILGHVLAFQYLSDSARIGLGGYILLLVQPPAFLLHVLLLVFASIQRKRTNKE
jgi:hypothetical protein